MSVHCVVRGRLVHHRTQVLTWREPAHHQRHAAGWSGAAERSLHHRRRLHRHSLVCSSEEHRPVDHPDQSRTGPQPLYEVKNATVGQNITLLCKAADFPIRAVKWIRSDLGSAEYVLFYRDGRPDPKNQQSSFKGRVRLSDSEVKKGNLSLTLTDVRSSDNGTYECRAVYGGSRRNKRALIDSQQPIKTIKLQVSDSASGFNFQAGDKPETPPIGSRGHAVTAVTAAGFVLTCLAAIPMFLSWKYKKPADSRSEAAADEPEAEELV